MADQPHPIDVHVGMRLRARRRILGMTQEKLGELLGLTFQQVQKYERGANRIGSSRLFELSQILQTPVSYFFEGMSGETSAAVGVAEPTEAFEHDSLASKETQDLLRHYYRIVDQKTRRKLLELIRMIGTDPGAV